jgi:regulatory protein
VIAKPRARKPVVPLQYAVAQLARREHSRAELRVKLRRKLRDEASPEEAASQVETVLDSLQAKGLLSDTRFAAALARTRADRFGTARIRYEMREHELPDEVVRAAVENLRATEEQRARDLWKRRFGREPANAAERARQMRFLAQRGFSTSVVVKVVRSAGEEE